MSSIVCYKGTVGPQGPLGPPGPPGISVSSVSVFMIKNALFTLYYITTVAHLLIFPFQQGPAGQKGSKGSTVSCVFILCTVSFSFILSSFLIKFTMPCFLTGFTRSEGRQWNDWTTWTTCKFIFTQAFLLYTWFFEGAICTNFILKQYNLLYLDLRVSGTTW